MKITINIPVTVEAEIESVTNGDEVAFNVEKTDFLRIKNATLPASILVPATAVSIVEE